MLESNGGGGGADQQHMLQHQAQKSGDESSAFAPPPPSTSGAPQLHHASAPVAIGAAAAVRARAAPIAIPGTAPNGEFDRKRADKARRETVIEEGDGGRDEERSEARERIGEQQREELFRRRETNEAPLPLSLSLTHSLTHPTSNLNVDPKQRLSTLSPSTTTTTTPAAAASSRP